MVGQETQVLPDPTQVRAYAHGDIMVKNDPAKYAETLCRDDLVGCSEYRHDNQISYFKDPLITGNSICEFQSQQNSGDTWGWFVRGVGKCTTNQNIVCNADAQCPAGAGQAAGRCDTNQKVACYPQFFQRGGMYDIWGNESPKYQGMVGSCFNTQNRCTELVDPADTSNIHPEGQPYYVIFDKTVENRLDDCPNGVSLRDGCVLFDKTDEPNKYFNSRATYELSAKGIPPYGVGGQGANPHGPVKAVPDPSDLNSDGNISDFERDTTIDTNRLIKVDRDRQCSEWLACKTAFPLTQQNGEQGSVCYQYRACDELGEGDAKCNSWVNELDPGEDLDQTLFPLNYREYVTRPVSWYDEEFSGYSLFNSFQITNFFYQSFSFPEDIAADLRAEAQKNYIVREVADPVLAAAAVRDDQRCIIDQDLNINEDVNNTDWHACGIDSGGRCYNQRCIYPVNGPFGTTVADPDQPTSNELRQLLGQLESNVCKSTPELDSPFPLDVSIPGGREPRASHTPGISDRKIFTQNVSGFEGANVCQNGNCSCQYQKITYQDGIVDYWPTQGAIPPEKICSGGPNDGEGCSQDDDCRPGDGEGAQEGVCSTITKRETQIGLDGFCLQYDLSRRVGVGQNPFACLTWLPIQVSAAAGDVYNAETKAGYDLVEDAGNASNGETYCYGATRASRGPYDRDFYPVNNHDAAVAASLTDEVYSQYFYLDGDDPGFPIRDSREGVNYFNCAYEFGGNCDDDVCWNPSDVPYQNAVCWPGNMPALYQAIRSWSWRKWPNSVILRLESGVRKANAESGSNDPGWSEARDTVQENEGFGIIDYGTVGREVGEDNLIYRAPYALVPKQDHCCDMYEYGTIMHEPRLWLDMYDGIQAYMQSQVGQLQGLDDNDFGGSPFLLMTYPQTSLIKDGTENPGRDVDRFITINPELLAPIRDAGPSEYFGGHADGLLYRSQAERFLNRQDLRRVYFLPLSYPGGLGEDGPYLLSPDVYIDMDALDRSETHAEARLTYDVAADGNYGLEFPGKKDRTDLAIWTYVLSNDTANNKLSEYAYSNYEVGSLEVWSGNEEISENYRRILELDAGRNKIHTRYVLAFSDWTFDDDVEIPSFILQGIDGEETEEEEVTGARIPPVNSEDPYNNQDDPFTAPCNDDVVAFTAIGMDFNRKGEFLGYITRHCNTGPEGTGGASGIEMAVVATLRDQCAAFMQVYHQNRSGLGETSNKAWTDNVWAGSDKVVADSIVQNTVNTPFGSLSSMGRAGIDIYVNDQGARYMFANESQGVPHSCTIDWLGYPTLDEKEPTYNFQRCAQVADSMDDGMKRQISRVDGYNVARDTILKNLFVKSFVKKRVSYAKDANNLLVRSIESGSDDLAGTEALDTLLPPKIYALNPFTCSDGPGGCTAAHGNAVTVNGTNAYVGPGGEFADYNLDGLFEENKDGDTELDPLLIGIGSYFARLQFFAFADHNRMPIRRVMIDWGDPDEPIMNEGRMGFYRNRKPFCEENNDIGDPKVGRCFRGGIVTQVTCDPTLANACPDEMSCVKPEGNNGLVDRGVKKQFGDLPRACIPGYFEFTNEYSCGPSDLRKAGVAGGEYVQRVSTLEASRVLQESWGLSPNEYVCVYVPKVQVMDNWGWCNGTCDDQTRGGNQEYPNGGCYNNEARGDMQCDNPNLPAWTPYRGNIIVIPSR